MTIASYLLREARIKGRYTRPREEGWDDHVIIDRTTGETIILPQQADQHRRRERALDRQHRATPKRSKA